VGVIVYELLSSTKTNFGREKKRNKSPQFSQRPAELLWSTAKLYVLCYK